MTFTSYDDEQKNATDVFLKNKFVLFGVGGSWEMHERETKIILLHRILINQEQYILQYIKIYETKYIVCNYIKIITTFINFKCKTGQVKTFKTH